MIPGSPNTTQWLSGGTNSTSGVAAAAAAIMTPFATNYPIGEENNRNFRVGNVSANCMSGTCAFNRTYREEDYDYFYRLFEMPVSPTASEDDFSGPALKPTVPPAGGKPAYWHNGDLDINSTWTVNAGEQLVIFVGGNLNLMNSAVIDVAPGGFVGFIVRGGITISPQVGHVNAPGNSEGVIEGVYIADGVISIQPSTEKFVGEGMFIGWGGVVMGRDYQGLDNNQYPAELFTYRPDLLTHAPDEFRRSVYEWEEVAPVTIGGLPTPTP
jgi:hypothetical protein